jgi:hypothetical protein
MNQISKHQAYRSRTKARAIALKGGKCERCGFADERPLRFHHVKPVRRGSNGLSRKALTSTTTHDAKGIRLQCHRHRTGLDAEPQPQASRNERRDALTVRAAAPLRSDACRVSGHRAPAR